MALFSTKAEKLSARSKGVSDVFRKTIASYIKINTEVDAERDEIAKEVKFLQEEDAKLEATRNENQKFVDKLEKLFN